MAVWWVVLKVRGSLAGKSLGIPIPEPLGDMGTGTSLWPQSRQSLLPWVDAMPDASEPVLTLGSTGV